MKTQSSACPLAPDLCVFIGRFQPLHAGHICVIREGLRQGKFMVVLIGSANEPRSPRNPFYFAERARVVRETFGNDPRLIVLPLEDSDYNLTDWLERAHLAVDAAWEQIRAEFPGAPEVPTVSLIGHAKDATSFYLNLFPRWGSIDVPQEHVMCATKLRQQLFGDREMIWPDLLAHENDETPWPMAALISRYTELARDRANFFLTEQRALSQAEGAAKPADLSAAGIAFLEEFLKTEDFGTVCAEYASVARNKFLWRHAPYAPIFQTADAMVVQSGHVLMIKRNSYPGKGLWALPGGYVEENEPVLRAALRELDEEAALKVPPAVLLGHIKDQKRFDAPFRSARGRVITEAYLIHLKPGPLPKTKKGGQPGDEETQDIAWKLISKLRREECFEDHYSIIGNLKGQI